MHLCTPNSCVQGTSVLTFTCCVQIRDSKNESKRAKRGPPHRCRRNWLPSGILAASCNSWRPINLPLQKAKHFSQSLSLALWRESSLCFTEKIHLLQSKSPFAFRVKGRSETISDNEFLSLVLCVFAFSPSSNSPTAVLISSLRDRSTVMYGGPNSWLKKMHCCYELLSSPQAVISPIGKTNAYIISKQMELSAFT